MVPPREAMESDLESEDIMDESDPEGRNGLEAFSSEVPVLMEDQDEDFRQDVVSDPYLDLNTAEGGYECKYCSFQTSELNQFTMHVDAEHPDVVLNTSYVCMECDYHTKRYAAHTSPSIRTETPLYVVISWFALIFIIKIQVFV